MSNAFYDPYTVIETKHLFLCILQKTDAAAIYHNINHDKEVLKYYLAPYIENEEDASVDSTVEFCEKTGRYAFAILLKDSEEVIGMLNQCSAPNIYMHNVELGYAIGRKYWNKGYTTEALYAAIQFFFVKGVHKITCSAITENKASIRVMEKCGMQYEGLQHEQLYWHEKYWDTVTYYLTSEMFHVKH